jgi:hypothetical protein
VLAASIDGAWLAATIAHRLDQAAADVDIVIDYLRASPPASRWSPSSPIAPIRASRSYRSTSARSPDRPRRFLQPRFARVARLQIAGSSQGSVSTREILAELPALALAITSGTFNIDARPTPLTDVEQARTDAAHTNQRLSSPHNPEHAQRTPTPFRALPPCRYPRRMNAIYGYRHLSIRKPIRLFDAASSE